MSKLIEIPCSYCGGILQRDEGRYKKMKSIGKKNFYHKECYPKVLHPFYHHDEKKKYFYWYGNH